MIPGLKRTQRGFNYRGALFSIGDGVVYNSPTGYKRGHISAWAQPLAHPKWMWVSTEEDDTLQRVAWADVVDVFEKRGER